MALKLFLLLLVATLSTGLRAQTYRLQPAPSPADNPLKGLVPYARPYPDRFPHSMEFNYLGLHQLMKGPRKFDWGPMESLLDDIASRGNQAVVRIYLEYPGKPSAIPRFLVDGGLKVTTYLNENTAPFPPTKVSTPDYEDPNLRDALQAFIKAFGEKYDGDARLGYITAGLLGTWGEWHTYPRGDLWASKQTQAIVLDAYESAFHRTPILLRYPAGKDHWDQTENADRAMGYHDDSFAWATLDTGKEDDSWFFVPAMKAAGATEKWKRHPVGGEIRPELWGKIFDADGGLPEQAQDFAKSVAETHATWLMDTGMFREVAPESRHRSAVEQVRRMGYDLHVRQVSFTIGKPSGRCQIALELVNQGVAPFYADWPTEIAFASSSREISQRRIVAGLSVRGHLPGKQPTILTGEVDLPSGPGSYTALLRVVNPLPNGKSLRFANAEQDQTVSGWLTLGTIEVQ